jgi:hypothetical protein
LGHSVSDINPLYCIILLILLDLALSIIFAFLRVLMSKKLSAMVPLAEDDLYAPLAEDNLDQ